MTGIHTPQGGFYTRQTSTIKELSAQDDIAGGSILISPIRGGEALQKKEIRMKVLILTIRKKRSRGVAFCEEHIYVEAGITGGRIAKGGRGYVVRKAPTETEALQQSRSA